MNLKRNKSLKCTWLDWTLFSKNTSEGKLGLNSDIHCSYHCLSNNSIPFPQSNTHFSHQHLIHLNVNHKLSETWSWWISFWVYIYYKWLWERLIIVFFKMILKKCSSFNYIKLWRGTYVVHKLPLLMVGTGKGGDGDSFHLC